MKVLKNRQSEKRKMLEGVKRSRKGVKGQLEKALQEHRTFRDEGEDEQQQQRRPSGGGKRRDLRDKKFGFGGRKKGQKRNTADSFGQGFEDKATRGDRKPKAKVVVGRQKKQPKGAKRSKRGKKAASLM